MSKFKDFIKQLGWQDLAALIIILVAVILNVGMTSKFQQLPSPLYGGDLYYQLGSVSHIRYGGNPFEASNVLDSEPGYYPLYGMIVGYFSLISNMDPMFAMILFSSVIIFFAGIIFYYLCLLIFEKKEIALLGVLLFINFLGFPSMKYSELTYWIIMGLFFLAFFMTLKSKKMSWAITTGVLYGLSALSHGVGFIASSIVFGIAFLYFVFIRYFDFEKKNLAKDFNKDVKNNLLIFGLIFVIGFLIALLVWYKPLFVYHGQSPNDYIRWNQIDYSEFRVQVKYLVDMLRGSFFEYRSSLFYFVITLLSSIGLLILFFAKNKKGKLGMEFISIITLAGFIGTFHYFLTEPILHTNFVPGHHHFFIMRYALIFLALISLKMVLQFFKKSELTAFILILVIILGLKVLAIPDISQDKWINVGFNPMNPDVTSMREWVIKNTDVNDVFLSSNELSFSLNAVTGRKLLVSRRAQNSIYLDNDRRYIDAAIILYGNDSAKRNELIDKYQVKYLYWSEYWMNTEYYFNEQGQMVGTFDPLAMVYKPEYKAELDNYGIKTFMQNDWLDPSLKSPDVRKYDIIYVLPANFSITQPWTQDLNTQLSEEWSYTYQGRKIAIIYRIN